MADQLLLWEATALCECDPLFAHHCLCNMMICSDAVSFCAFYIQGNFGSYFDLVAKERRSAVRIRAQTLLLTPKRGFLPCSERRGEAVWP